MAIQCSNLKNPLNISDSVLSDFIMLNPNGAHVKDSKTGNYMLANQAMLSLKNIKDLSTLNLSDVDKFMRPYWGKDYAKSIAELDKKVIKTGKSVKKNEDIILNSKKQIYVHNIFKFPLNCKNKTVSAIITILDDITSKLNLFHLFDLYIEKLPSQNIGIDCFMKYLGLDTFFQDNLTFKEINCLLHMVTNPAYKSVAKKMNISIKTVETHVSHIIDKIKNSQLSTIISHLRLRNQNTQRKTPC